MMLGELLGELFFYELCECALVGFRCVMVSVHDRAP